jgi:hypothetical protein
MSDTRKSIVLEKLKSAGDKGATVFELMMSGGGTDSRKRISELRAEGYQISDTWQLGSARVKRYFLNDTKEAL